MKKLLFFTSILLLFVLACNKNDSNNDNTSQTQQWKMEIDVNITNPDPSPFQITGEVDINVTGNNVTFSGDYTVGGLNFDNVVFHGTLDGTKVTMTTNYYKVNFDAQGTTYTEEIFWVMNPFDVVNETASGSGTISATKTPGNTTESGTFTFSAWRK